MTTVGPDVHGATPPGEPVAVAEPAVVLAELVLAELVLVVLDVLVLDVLVVDEEGELVVVVVVVAVEPVVPPPAPVPLHPASHTTASVAATKLLWFDLPRMGSRPFVEPSLLFTAPPQAGPLVPVRGA